VIVRPTIAGLTAFALLLLSGLATAEAQPAGKLYRVAMLETRSITLNAANVDAFRQGLRELGYREGQNLEILYRSSDGRDDRFPDLASELVKLKVDLILTRGTPAALAAKRATQTLPVVMAAAGDPVGAGIVAHLARPGGNITGLSSGITESYPKRVELLGQLLPRLKRIAAIFNMGNSAVHAEALVVGLDGVTQANLRPIADLAKKQRLPSIYPAKDYAYVGGLMTYGSSDLQMYHRAATFVDKILKGAKPSDLPVEQPTKFELVINLKTAKALGITIPPSLLLRADEVVE
jgi:putative ABC transport system substrate-binding protein